MSEPNKLTALREAVALKLGIRRFDGADIGRVIKALGIPAATLRGLRDGSLVVVPREPTEAWWNS